MSQEIAARDLNARVVWHELMLALLVAMQAIQMFWMSGDGISAVMAYGFGIIAAFLWLRVIGLFVGPSVHRLLGREVS